MNLLLRVVQCVEAEGLRVEGERTPSPDYLLLISYTHRCVYVCMYVCMYVYIYIYIEREIYRERERERERCDHTRLCYIILYYML